MKGPTAPVNMHCFKLDCTLSSSHHGTVYKNKDLSVHKELTCEDFIDISQKLTSPDVNPESWSIC